MANLSFDFNKVKRSFMTVTLKDNRKLIVKMPMKKTFEKLSALQEMDTDSMTAEDAMDTLGGLCAEILSHNMTADSAGRIFAFGGEGIYQDRVPKSGKGHIPGK